MIQILWEDADLLAVVKPVGLEVDSGGRKDDLVREVNAFAFHRLDRDTSGIVLLGKTRKYAKPITELFEQKRIRKAYQAVVRGEWTASKVDLPIEEQTATTTFRKLKSGTFAGVSVSLIEALPKTGRTHQIRIHCASSGHAILGDARYGLDQPPLPTSEIAGHALHAYRLTFRHPANGETIQLRAEPTWSDTWLKEFAR